MQRGWQQALERIGPEPIIETLEPLATPRRRQRLQEVFSRRLNSVTVVMDAPHNPHNGAAVLRSCDAFGISRLHVVERSEPFVASGQVAKGSERWVEVLAHRSVADAVAALERSGHQLVGTHPDGAMLPEELAAIPRLGLVMGNEHDGIHEELMAACVERVRVPMRGFVESLNVSVTAAIMLAQATAHRPGDLSRAEQRRWYARALLRDVRRAPQILAARGLIVEG